MARRRVLRRRRLRDEADGRAAPRGDRIQNLEVRFHCFAEPRADGARRNHHEVPRLGRLEGRRIAPNDPFVAFEVEHASLSHLRQVPAVPPRLFVRDHLPQYRPLFVSVLSSGGSPRTCGRHTDYHHSASMITTTSPDPVEVQAKLGGPPPDRRSVWISSHPLIDRLAERQIRDQKVGREHLAGLRREQNRAGRHPLEVVEDVVPLIRVPVGRDDGVAEEVAGKRTPESGGDGGDTWIGGRRGRHGLARQLRRWVVVRHCVL
mmetsp:Transcript_27663/g.69744  ORF Transcript_27663/g.69744 Transcript_27663/m.69744 type:complete len:262 (-) Transcript_27663:207-992(-)